MNKVKVLLVANMYPTKNDPSFGTFVKVFDDGLKMYRKAYKVERVLIRGRSGNILIKLSKYLLFYVELFFCLVFRSYDFVYVHTITFPTPCIRLANLFRNLNLIFNVHGADVLTKSKLTKILKEMCRPLLIKAKYIVVPSKYFEEVVISEFPELIGNKIIVSASGGIEKDFFSKRMVAFSGTLKLGYVSRLTKGKGWNTLLDALKILHDKNVDFEAMFVGVGEDCNELLKQIHQGAYGDKVRYLGPMGHDKLPDFYKSINLFVFPTCSASESLGLVGLEAMAASVPVIGSNIGGITTYLRDGMNGFLFTPGNSFELANSIIKFILLDEMSRSEMMQSAYNTATKYETSVVLTKLFDKIFPKNEQD